MEIQLWREKLMPYSLAVDEIMLKFNNMVNEYREAGQYSPIERVQGRVKKLSSILEKAQRKNIPLEQITERIDDIAGIRIICQFVDDIEKVVQIIRRRTDMNIQSEVDYVNHQKPSGYRSYHVNILYEVETIHGRQIVPVEIQIRTLAMNFWATIEHSLKYKYREEIPEQVAKRLSASAEAVYLLDSEMSSIREEVMDAQEMFREKAALVADILNNLQNLYVSSNQYADVMEDIQKEFYDIYYQGSLDDLEEFGEKLDKLAAVKKVQNLSRGYNERETI